MDIGSELATAVSVAENVAEDGEGSAEDLEGDVPFRTNNLGIEYD